MCYGNAFHRCVACHMLKDLMILCYGFEHSPVDSFCFETDLSEAKCLFLP